MSNQMAKILHPEIVGRIQPKIKPMKIEVEDETPYAGNVKIKNDLAFFFDENNKLRSRTPKACTAHHKGMQNRSRLISKEVIRQRASVQVCQLLN